MSSSRNRFVQSSKRLFAASLLTLLTCGLAGCGGEPNPYAYVKQGGSVSYDDGTPIPAAEIRLTFIPQDAKAVDLKTAVPNGHVTITSGDGKFTEITSHKPGDGLVPGMHKVTIQAFDKNEKELDAIPAEYKEAGKTPLLVDTSKPDTFNIKIKKPTGGKAVKK